MRLTVFAIHFSLKARQVSCLCEPISCLILPRETAYDPLRQLKATFAPAKTDRAQPAAARASRTCFAARSRVTRAGFKTAKHAGSGKQQFGKRKQDDRPAKGTIVIETRAIPPAF
jgi:hypothetical protein